MEVHRRSSHEIGRGFPYNRGLYLDLERNGQPGMVSVGVGPGRPGGGGGDMSPPSDNVLFDNQCYATTPSSSNGNSDMENPPQNSHAGPRRGGEWSGAMGGIPGHITWWTRRLLDVPHQTAGRAQASA